MMNKLIKSTVFLIIGVMLFICVQNIMIPEHLDVDDQEQIMNGFDALEDNSLDVLFVGASTMFYGALPMELYRDYQIRSYNLSSSGQPTECSYFLAKYAFKTQSLKAVVLDVTPALDAEDKFPEESHNSF